MNKFTTIKTLLIGAIAISTFTSCTKKKDDTVTPAGAYSSGVFITNEGNFGEGNGSVSFFNKNSGEITNDIYGSANSGAKLGDVVQSVNVINSNAYVVTNGSNKIQVVNAANFSHITTITDVIQPRYIVPVSDQKAYVSQWGTSGMNGAVKVLNLSTNTFTKTISTGKGAEKMLKHGDYIYVTCSGGYSDDETVSVINTTTDAISTSITVGSNPSGIVEDANGKIWVLCAGKYKSDYSGLEVPGKLVRINPATNTVEASFDFASMSSQPSNLKINNAKTKLYYTYSGKVCTQDITASVLSTTSFLNRSFYGMGIDPTNDMVYGAVAGDFKSPGRLVRFNNTGSPVDSVNAGIGTSGFFFK